MSEWCPTPPTPPTPQDRRQMVSEPIAVDTLCHYGWRPLLITGLLRQTLIGHFSNVNNLEEPDLRRHPLLWQDGPTTGILIESVFRWTPELMGQRPALLIKGNEARNMRVTVGDLYGADEQGFNHYSTLWVGSHTIFVISSAGAGCQVLATAAQRELTQFGPELVKTMRLHRFQVMSVGEMAILEEADQNFVIPVTVGWCYAESWAIKSNAPVLQKIDISNLAI